ncbi:MerR family transcriptional regulator [Microbacterium sp. VKM Ac-2923]|uniref:MerR family transcriptional regulator n=1 Tax=Microbacterium sp. VKM Ac-2923 TaxID=2929476 RepID=UPI001FB31CE7|nr:MerR family transcriptional regulator [Microbacterium sp. VKM Ac-2923]MCJ1706251.1 MerR family transcriptional regulator [Microbacterium sp. VKM Ac-2923]
MNIGEVARLVGVSTKTVRHYHRVGVLLDPVRDANGYRTYGADDVARLLTVRRLRSAGMSLPTIKTALEGWDDRSAFVGEIEDAIATIEADIRRLTAQRASLGSALGSPDPWAMLLAAAPRGEHDAAGDPGVTPEQLFDAAVIGSLLALDLRPPVRQQIEQIVAEYERSRTGTSIEGADLARLHQLIAALPDETVALVAALTAEHVARGARPDVDRERATAELARVTVTKSS